MDNKENILNSTHNLTEKLSEKHIEVIPAKSTVTIEELKELYPDKKIIACDFYVSGIESGDEINGGYVKEDLINIDHHSPTEKMSRQISSANLAIDYVNNFGPAPEDVVVVINHVDCDSLLSSSIIRGILPPDSKFGEAAIAADHLGAENNIADLLQPLEKKRDINFSLRNLSLLLDGEPLEPEALELVEKRQKDRELLKEIVQNNEFRDMGGVYYLELGGDIDSAMLPALLPDAKIILIGHPMEGSDDKFEIHLRLGPKAPSGLILNNLDLPNFGGRWNAGSTKRSGGSSLNVEEYASLVNEQIRIFESDKSAHL